MTLLRSPALAQFNLNFLGTRITGRDFARIADAIQYHRIHVFNTFSNPRGASKALYVNNPLYDQILVFSPRESYPNSLSERATIVHEAVHAIMDMNQKRISGTDDEAIAYVAQLLYMSMEVTRGRRSLGQPPHRTIESGERESHGQEVDFWTEICRSDPEISRCSRALRVAVNMIVQDILDGHEPASEIVSNLRSSISSHPVYSATSVDIVNSLDGHFPPAWQR